MLPACSWRGWRPISASPGLRSTRVRPASKPTWWRTPAAASTPRVRWPRPGPIWIKPASSAYAPTISRPEKTIRSAGRRFGSHPTSTDLLGRAAGLVAVGSRGRRPCATLGDADQRRTQHAIADHEAGLHDLNDGTRRHAGIGNLEHRMLEIRIEFFARRVELLDPVLFQCVEQRALGQFDALDQGLQ